MEILSETPFKILHQGYSDTIVEYKNIENDIPLYEQRILESKTPEFKKQQVDFNSAELYNNELRTKYQHLNSYKIQDVTKLYKTSYFMEYKVNQIIAVAEYLQKVLKMIFSINKQVLKIERKSVEICHEKQFKSSLDMEIFKTKLTIDELLDALCDIKVSITELQIDKCSVGIKEFVDEIWETLLLSFAICYVPDEYASKVDALFPAVTLKKISSLGDEFKDKKIVLQYLTQLKNRLFFILNLFITHLSNQFSYYVTSESFLNNPKGLTIFVVPMSVYIMFDFYQSGLTESETVKKDINDYYTINEKYMKFLKSIETHLKALLTDAYATLEKVKLQKEFFNINKLMDYYEEKVPYARTAQLKTFFSDPVVFEKVSTMVDNVKSSMSACIPQKKNPWDAIEKVKESKDIDNSTIYFLLKLYEMRPGELLKFPQSQLKDFFNLCAYSERPSTGCMNEHVRRYRQGKYKVSNSYENLFQPILMN